MTTTSKSALSLHAFLWCRPYPDAVHVGIYTCLALPEQTAAECLIKFYPRTRHSSCAHFQMVAMTAALQQAMPVRPEALELECVNGEVRTTSRTST